MQNNSIEEGNETAQPAQPSPKKRGFAAIDPSRMKEISRSGGKAAHAVGRAHQWTSEEAKAAGRKGGLAPHVRRGRVAAKKEGV